MVGLILYLKKSLNYFFEVYWDFLNGDEIEKYKFGIPNHIWKRIPDKLKYDYNDLQMK